MIKRIFFSRKIKLNNYQGETYSLFQKINQWKTKPTGKPKQ